MKKLALFMLTGLSFAMVNAQQTTVSVSKGDVYEIQPASTHQFNHIYFPRKNFIIKRGGIANMKSVFGTKVEVTDIKYSQAGSPIVTLKPVNGRKFFRIYPTVEANLQKALESGELN